MKLPFLQKTKTIAKAEEGLPITQQDLSATNEATKQKGSQNGQEDEKKAPEILYPSEELEKLLLTAERKPLIRNPANFLKKNNYDLTNLLSPQAMEIDFDHIKINDVFFRTLFVSGYPRFVSPGWLEQVVNFDGSLDISFYIYPIEGKGVLTDLRHKVAEMEAEIATDLERGKIVDPSTQAKLEDARMLQQTLVQGSEHFFEFGFYITIPARSLEELNHTTTQVQALLGALLIVSQHASLDMENAFLTTIPFGIDKLSITRNMDTTSLATTFPLTSAELSSDKGILYGINPLNDSFIIFDRFSLENSNMSIFATSGAGKSYFVKLESVRSLMLGAEIIVIDPESEYKELAEAVGGQFISFSFDSPSKINPFDLSQIYEEGENQLGLKILSLHSLFKIIMGELTPLQEALLDRALVSTYRAKGITQDSITQTKEPPLMEDLYKALIGMETPDAMNLAARIEKFVKGSFVGIFDQQTNVDINNPFTVFSVKELEDTLRPIAMFVILDFIWTRVKKDLKKRILVVDEAWHMMRYKDSAQFLWSIVKRARKYYLGITTITQDVEDFLSQDIGKAVVTNSALRLLLKQSPAAIDKVGQVFYLSEGEQNLLLGANIGEGIFFAGRHHVPISVVASPEEHKLITTKPEELLKQKGIVKNPLEAVKPLDIIQEDYSDLQAQEMAMSVTAKQKRPKFQLKTKKEIPPISPQSPKQESFSKNQPNTSIPELSQVEQKPTPLSAEDIFDTQKQNPPSDSDAQKLDQPSTQKLPTTDTNINKQ